MFFPLFFILEHLPETRSEIAGTRPASPIKVNNEVLDVLHDVEYSRTSLSRISLSRIPRCPGRNSGARHPILYKEFPYIILVERSQGQFGPESYLHLSYDTRKLVCH